MKVPDVFEQETAILHLTQSAALLKVLRDVDNEIAEADWYHDALDDLVRTLYDTAQAVSRDFYRARKTTKGGTR